MTLTRPKIHKPCTAAAVVGIVALALGACTGGPRLHEAAPVPALAAGAWAVTEARHDDVALTLLLGDGDSIAYVGSAWPPLPPPASTTGLGERLPIATLKTLRDDPDWQESEDEERIRVLSASDWIDFRTVFLQSITPIETGFGNVIEFSDEEFFLYYDADGVAAVYDGWACLGSANFDKLSFRINREINLATSDEDSVRELLERVFEADFGVSVELTEPFPVDWSNHLAEMVADFLL